MNTDIENEFENLAVLFEKENRTEAAKWVRDFAAGKWGAE